MTVSWGVEFDTTAPWALLTVRFGTLMRAAPRATAWKFRVMSVPDPQELGIELDLHGRGGHIVTACWLGSANTQVQLQGRLDGHALDRGKIEDAGRNVGQRGQRVRGVTAARCIATESPPGTPWSRLAASRR